MIKKFLGIILCICQLLLLSACGSEEQQPPANELAMENFLSIFFTTNYNGRYDTFMQTMEEFDTVEDIEAMQACAQAYYAKLGEWTTEEELENIQANRMLYKLEANLMEQGYMLGADEITLAPKEGDIYDFTVELTRTD